MVVNEYKNVIIDKYTEYDEDARLISDRGHNVEYLTTMRYIQKFLKPGDKILEIGAATGRYSIALAKMGYEVTAVDLVPKHVEIMKSKTRRLKNFKCMVADALDLSQFEDNSFDVVLNFGPMYHLFNKKDKNRAIKETLRVAAQNGICMFAYLPCASFITGYGLRHQCVEHLCAAMDDTGRIKDTPEEVFTCFYIEDFKKLFKRTDTKYITNVATDGVSYVMREWLEQLTKKDYQAFLNWHFMTCERLDQQGYSSHLLYICQKK
ncbi:MAG: methyltransferase domain-containing protein [Alphaproteobacteria bacterium]|nr:methyltransferase domain-containing protein [Alphaproteobacteria bacterium]